MTRFVRIDPTTKTIATIEGDDPIGAATSLKSGQTDHGVVAPGIGIFVWEYGLLEGEGPYFALGGQLFSGEAILYAYDKAGDTIDMPDTPLKPPTWLADKQEVELAIMAGVVERPETRVNGAVVWRWS